MKQDAMDPVDATVVRIRDKGEVKELDYDGAMTHHMNSLWWGTAVGYRAMQAAAKALSKDGLWSRDDLYVVGAHPGPGVRDVLELCGIRNILTKVHGSSNPINLVKATITGLMLLRTREETARLRGVTL